MFDSALPPDDTPLMQTAAFAAALHLIGERPVTLPSGLVLLSRRIAGVPMLMLPRAVPPPDLGAQMAQAGLRRPVLLSPERRCALPRGIRLRAPRDLLSLDLGAPQEARRAGLHQNWRHQLGQAERSGLRMRHATLAPIDPLLTLEATQARARRYMGWPPALTAAFARAAPQNTHLFSAYLRGHRVADMLFLTHGTRASLHIAHTTPQGRAVHAHNLLLWEGSVLLAKRGISAIELGPATTPDIDRFKRRAGAVAQPTGGTWLCWPRR